MLVQVIIGKKSKHLSLVPPRTKVPDKEPKSVSTICGIITSGMIIREVAQTRIKGGTKCRKCRRMA